MLPLGTKMCLVMKLKIKNPRIYLGIFISIYTQDLINSIMRLLSHWSSALKTKDRCCLQLQQWWQTSVRLKKGSLLCYCIKKWWHFSMSLVMSCTICVPKLSIAASLELQSKKTSLKCQVKCSKTGCGKKISSKKYQSITKLENLFLMTWLTPK